MKVVDDFDVIIVGSGGSGLRAAIEIKNKKVLVLSKVFPTRSHTVAAQGGINAALSNSQHDNWKYHMYDTVKGSDWLGDQNAISFMTEAAPAAVIELEHMGMPFSRDDNGKIYQRQFGGQTVNYGEKIARRTCAVADRTGHALLHTLYQQCIKHAINFNNEWLAIDLVMDEDGGCCGVVAICIESGEICHFTADSVLLATGGAGQIFASTTNAYTCTGDGLGMVARQGIALQDMEMWQFHPTGLYGSGVLISEAVRGEGGYLVNSDGDRFMQSYSPYADLACRDIVSRSSMLEIIAGRGCGEGKDHVLLMLQQVPELETKLPGIRELAKTYVNRDPLVDPLPVVPTQHYMMGGIPTDINGQVIRHIDGSDRKVRGLFAVGECACVSIHGANRLGGNSLIDLVVFGKAVGAYIDNQDARKHNATDASINFSRMRYDILMSSERGPSVSTLRHEMKEVMSESFGVFRNGDDMKKGLQALEAIYKKSEHLRLEDQSRVFNTALIEALELQNMIAVAVITARSAYVRTETRGAHSRVDYPDRDDTSWHAHNMVALSNDCHKRPVDMCPENCDSVALDERN